jgi:hypothetical protein
LVGSDSVSYASCTRLNLSSIAFFASSSSVIATPCKRGRRRRAQVDGQAEGGGSAGKQARGKLSASSTCQHHPPLFYTMPGREKEWH